MLNTDNIPKLSNREKIKKLNDKIVNTELKIDKNESKRIILKKCIEETENKLNMLQNKSLKHPDNEKIIDEMEDSGKRIREGNRILENLNEKMLRQEIVLVKFKQKRDAEIKSGLEKYLYNLNSDYEKLHQGLINDSKRDEEKETQLKELKTEIDYIKELIG